MKHQKKVHRKHVRAHKPTTKLSIATKGRSANKMTSIDSAEPAQPDAQAGPVSGEELRQPNSFDQEGEGNRQTDEMAELKEIDDAE